MVRCSNLGIGRPVVSVFSLLGQTALVCATVSAFATAVQAQPRTTPASYTRDQARQSIEDLSGMMDDFSLRRTRSGGTAPIDNIPAKQLTAEMRAVRPLIKDFATEVPQLSYLLSDELRRLPNIRSLVNDSTKVAALAVNLDRNAQRLNDHRQLVDDFEQLDATWRELAYRLEAVRGLSKEVRDETAALTDL